MVGINLPMVLRNDTVQTYMCVCYQWTCCPHVNGSRIMSKLPLGCTVGLQGK